MRQTIVLLSVGLLIVFFFSPPRTANATIRQIQEMVQRHGKERIIDFFMEKQGRCTTQDGDGSFSLRSGYPDPQFVTPASILIDCKNVQISPANLDKYLSSLPLNRAEASATVPVPTPEGLEIANREIAEKDVEENLPPEPEIEAPSELAPVLPAQLEEGDSRPQPREEEVHNREATETEPPPEGRPGIISFVGRLVLFVLFPLLILAGSVVLLLPPLQKLFRLRTRARQDYRNALGTKHLRQLDCSLRSLDTEIKKNTNRIEQIKKKLQQLDLDCNRKIDQALTCIMIDHSFLRIRGVGPKLGARIIDECFDGSLDSLQRAHQVVQGIGREKQWQINNWVNETRNSMTELRKADFPGRREIMEGFATEKFTLQKELGDLNLIVDQMMDLRRHGVEQMQELRQIRWWHFRQALAGDDKARAGVDRYLHGVFPPWDGPPDWYEALLAYG